jgi:hypothetical protein
MALLVSCGIPFGVSSSNCDQMNIAMIKIARLKPRQLEDVRVQTFAVLLALVAGQGAWAFGLMWQIVSPEGPHIELN